MGESIYERSPSETVAFLLELARRQAARRRPADLVRQLDCSFTSSIEDVPRAVRGSFHGRWVGRSSKICPGAS